MGLTLAQMKHLRHPGPTRPEPIVQGGALRSVSLRERLYARAPTTSEERAAELPIWSPTATTGIALMAVSAPSHQSAGSAYPETTC